MAGEVTDLNLWLGSGASIFVLLAALALQMLARPYPYAFQNTLEVLLILASILVVILGLVYTFVLKVQRCPPALPSTASHSAAAALRPTRSSLSVSSRRSSSRSFSSPSSSARSLVASPTSSPSTGGATRPTLLGRATARGSGRRPQIPPLLPPGSHAVLPRGSHAVGRCSPLSCSCEVCRFICCCCVCVHLLVEGRAGGFLYLDYLSRTAWR